MSYTPKHLRADSRRYDCLYAAAQSIKGVDGITCEIGLRRGGGSETIVQGCLDNDDKRVHIAIDPYGDIPYALGSGHTHFDYTNDMRGSALPEIHKWMHDQGVYFMFLGMEDTQFFYRFADGVPTYLNGVMTLENTYALVHFDGPHAVTPLRAEVDFFGLRSTIGSQWVFDDVDTYPHEKDVHPLIEELGFEIVEKADPKWRYARVR